MNDVQNIIEWVQSHVAWVKSLSGPEVECDALVEWLEMEDKAALRRGGLIVARITVGLVGFLAGFMLTGVITINLGLRLLPSPPAFAGFAAGGALGSVLLVRLCFGPNRKSAFRSNRDVDAMGSIAHLRNVHGYRGLRKELGEHGVMELNEGAQLFLRCRSILTSAPWTPESPDDPWAEARNDLLRAMESAMDRLTLYVVKKRSFADIGPVLDEMRTASNEIQRITAQRSSVSGGAGRDLRASLARMKELAAAEDELLRVRE